MAFDYINALLKKEVTRTPIWVMRQAGRYLPEYRATRKKAGDFLTLCKSSDLACEVTLQPLDRFDLDAAILFSDILTIPDAMGLGLHFVEGEGPKFTHPLKTLKEIELLKKPDVSKELYYVSEAVSVIKKNLRDRVPLIGFTGSPWTLATYMVEGSSSKAFSKVKGLMYENPKHMHQLLDVLADTVIDYLNSQIEAGADVIQIFDSWAGLLEKKNLPKYCFNPTLEILERTKKFGVPIICFPKGIKENYSNFCSIVKPDCISIDYDVDPSWIKERANGIPIQGGLNPKVLLSDKENLKKETLKYLDIFKDHPYIFNLGHGVLPETNPNMMDYLVKIVKDY